MTTAVSNQNGFRGRNDTVALNTDTWTFGLNANFTQAVDATFRVRYLIAETAGSNFMKAYKWQFNLAGGGETDVSGTSALQWALSGQYADGDATTQVIGAGSFVTGFGSEGDNLVPDAGSITINSSETELEGAFSIASGQVSDLQTVTLRVVTSDGTPLTNYNQSLTITIDKPTPSANVPASTYHRNHGTAA